MLSALGAKAESAVEAVRATHDVLDELLPRPRRLTRLDGSAPIRYLADQYGHSFTRGKVNGAPDDRQEEAYSIHISPRGIYVVSGGRLGELRARATLEQLSRLTNKDDPIPACEIVDWPELPLRDAMLDTGRNFIEFEALTDLVDHLALYKMNVFHWHLTDDFGWRLESKLHPELQSDRATARQKGCFYTQAQFRELVDYGWERGVTIVPELDVPGHTLAFRRGIGVEKMREEKARGIISELIDELCAIAPAERMPYIHLGTDEADPGSGDGDEWVPHEWIAEWAARVAANGRTLLGWWPGERIEIDGPQIKGIRGWVPPFAAITIYSDAFWNGRDDARPEYCTHLPAPGTPGFDFAADLERRILAQRDKVFANLMWASRPPGEV